MALRLGDLLVKQGVITEPQRDEILEAQRRNGRPFGVLAERMFGVSPRDVEAAWAEQYASLCGTCDPTKKKISSEALAALERRQAWQFQVLPMGFEGEDLVVATTKANLPRAMRFLGWRVSGNCKLVVAKGDLLEKALTAHYPMAGMSAALLSATLSKA